MPQTYRWSALSKLQVGRYAEYLTKMRFTLLGFDVYTSEVDERGIDFVVRQAPVNGGVPRYWDVQVKSARLPKSRYVFSPKEKFRIRPNLLAVIVVLQDEREPDLFLIPSTSWQQPDSDLAGVLVDRDYEGLKSKPEYGVNLSNKGMPVLERFRLGSASVKVEELLK